MPLYAQEKNVELFKKHNILSKNEIHSRMEILLENYSNIVHIEALTSIDIARKHIIPAVISYQTFLLKEIELKNKYSSDIKSRLEENLLKTISDLADKFYETLEKLDGDERKYKKNWENLKKARFCKNVLLRDMQLLRSYADKMELLIGKEFISFPTYEDILYSVKY